MVAGRRHVVQATGSDDQRPAGRGAAVILDQPGNRAQLGLHVRRGAHRQPGRLDDASRRQRTHQPGHRLRCPFWFGLHPFLRHYQAKAGGGCDPAGSTGEWWAASGASNGYEQWAVDLSAYAGTDVEVSISYASDDLFQFNGVVVDDVVVSTGEGSTSFEDDGDELDGWTVPGSPPGSAPNPNDWIVATRADAPTPLGEIASSRWTASPRSSTSWRATSGRTPSRPRAASSTTWTNWLRAGDADPSGLFTVVLHRHHQRRQRLRPRDRPPVGRRRPRSRAVAAHLAQRGIRDVRRVVVERCRGLGNRPADLRLLRRASSRPTTRSGP